MAHGITTVREPGGRGVDWAVNLKKLSAENKIVAPRIFAYTSLVKEVKTLIHLMIYP